ncbi:fumarylacetoacetate hydrolase [Paenibacillus sp. H1-7]|uniref:fumarylacetoacetate hydrolase family protein n=1 Tax=Paenibacillus sp. H1-7 TaxID=2282849 RepID=UPI001EF80BB6|nr:fumarylacetoacetate hydrolase family protein [Paenibacillus sp. H1-7]ULL15206.1 fumarylacetoacetate hydrolase [Paenibacillus sp. H1-7]
MRIIRFIAQDSGEPQLAAITDEGAGYALPYRDYLSLVKVAESRGASVLELVQSSIAAGEPFTADVSDLQLLTPIEAPEVWAAGVTYEKSREARNYEATAGKMDASTFYDKVYDAERPELFFKSTAARTVAPGGEVQLRSDSQWQVPEPELGLVLDGQGRIIGYTIGNDMSCRDIEGDNPLYLPQAKMWKRSCSIGPAIRLVDAVPNPYDLDITCSIYRGGEQVFEGKANTKQLKRRLEELVSFLVRDNEIYEGTVLLTGTCIVPPNEFTLAGGDRIEIEIGGIGKLINPVACAG